MIQDGQDLMTREQVAKRLGIAVQTLAKWACQGKGGLPFVKLGRAVRYRPADVERFVAANVTGAVLVGPADGSGFAPPPAR